MTVASTRVNGLAVAALLVSARLAAETDVTYASDEGVAATALDAVSDWAEALIVSVSDEVEVDASTMAYEATPEALVVAEAV